MIDIINTYICYLNGKKIYDNIIFYDIMKLINKYDIKFRLNINKMMKISYDFYHFILNNKKIVNIIKPIVIMKPEIKFDTIKIIEIQGNILKDNESSAIPEIYFQKICKNFPKKINNNFKNIKNFWNYYLNIYTSLCPTIINGVIVDNLEKKISFFPSNKKNDDFINSIFLSNLQYDEINKYNMYSGICTYYDENNNKCYEIYILYKKLDISLKCILPKTDINEFTINLTIKEYILFYKTNFYKCSRLTNE